MLNFRSRFISVFVLLFASLAAHGEPSLSTLPAAPTPATAKSPHFFTAADWSIIGTLYATHVADYLSTDQCIHGVRCHEAVLPQWLVHRSGLFAAYEITTASLEVYGQYKLAKMGHRRLARVLQIAQFSYTAEVVAHNCEVSWHTPPLPGSPR